MTKLVVWLRTLLDAIRHVRTSGQTTRRRARSRAERPAGRCPTCKQSRSHSPHWEDHITHHWGTP